MYRLTYSDGTVEDITDEDVQSLEDEVQFVGYKRSYSKNFNSVSIEMSSNVGHLGLKKTMKFIQQKVEYEASLKLKEL